VTFIFPQIISSFCVSELCYCESWDRKC